MINARRIQSTASHKLSHLRSEVMFRQLKEDIENIDNYRRTKDAVDGRKKAADKEKFRHEHGSDLIIHDAAMKYIRKRFPDGKLPMIKDLRTEEKELKAEKNKLYECYYKAKDELSELRTAEKNLAEILGQTLNEPGRTESRKKNDELE